MHTSKMSDSLILPSPSESSRWKTCQAIAHRTRVEQYLRLLCFGTLGSVGTLCSRSSSVLFRTGIPLLSIVPSI